MSKRKAITPNIELGILDSYDVEDEAIVEEIIPTEDVGTITKGKIVGIKDNVISFVLNGYGYSTEANTDEDWVKIGANISIIHKGTPGCRDFTIIEMKNNE